MDQSRSAFKDGLVVGAIAYLAVAAFYSAFDFLAARGTLFTVNVLGQAVFRGLRDPSVLQLPMATDYMAVFWYNAVHFSASMAIGQVVMALVDAAERDARRSGFAFTIIAAGFALTVAAVGYVTEPMRPVLPWWSIVVANGAAVVLAWVYLGSKRPGVWRALTAFTR